MKDEDRQAIMGILREHGYGSFSPNKRYVLFDGNGRFGEHISVHPKSGRWYTLYVRRNGWEYLEPIQALMGGDRGGDDGNALEFAGLDLVQLESKLKQLVTTMERVC